MLEIDATIDMSGEGSACIATRSHKTRMDTRINVDAGSTGMSWRRGVRRSKGKSKNSEETRAGENQNLHKSVKQAMDSEFTSSGNLEGKKRE